MNAGVRIAPNRVIVDAPDMQLCGIAIPFTATLTPGNVAVSARGTARNQALADTVPCLWGDNIAATGSYDLDVELSASAPPAELLRAARGSFRVASRSGRIHRLTALSRALAVDEVAARSRAKPADMLARGLEYQEITAAGTLEASRVRLDRGMLDSPSLGLTVSGEFGVGDGRLDLQALVAPLDGVHRVMRQVPVLGRVLRTPLVVVPVSITGRVADPEVRVLPGAAVGTTLINLMSTTLLVPVHLIDPEAGRNRK